jgi:hypothetical protein
VVEDMFQRRAPVNTKRTLGLHKMWEFLDQLSSYQLLRKDSTPWSYLVNFENNKDVVRKKYICEYTNVAYLTCNI